MSGFVSLFDRSESGVSRKQLQSMNHAIRHRGPDGSEMWCDAHIGLGHQQLQSTPESRFDVQPRQENGLVLTGDIRIDNRSELLKHLSVSERPEKVPDSQLLMDAYREWGTDCISRIYGAFAFAIWDDDESQLFMARDRLGVKPFYYHLSPDTFAAASEKKGLLTLSSVAGEIDETKIGDFLIAMYEDRERTFFESITRLPPAHTMVVDSTEMELSQYWDLDPTRTISMNSDAAYERRFRELFEEAVKARLRTSVPVGTSLSGGIDSSSVTVVARELLPEAETLHTFSNVYDDAPSSDEREFIEPVVKQEGIESHYVFPEQTRGLLDTDEMETYLDQPPHNTMHFAVRGRTRRAAENDVGVVLGGELGDSAIGYGLGVLPELFWTGRWLHLYSELRSMADILDAPVGHLLKRHVLTELIPEPVGRWRKKLRKEYQPLVEENPTLNPQFVERIGLLDRYENQRVRRASLMPRARRLQRRSLLTGRNTTNFEVLDLIHAACGVEPRYPFADARLLEFSLAIPATQQFSDGWTRSIVRRSLGGLLPEKVQWRPWKTSVNEAFWNALSEESDRIVELCDNSSLQSQYIDSAALKASHSDFQDEPSSQDARALWRALSLTSWLEEYGSGKVRSPREDNLITDNV
jgi:asparagine synthase (glutamine-hydrolysing)